MKILSVRIQNFMGLIGDHTLALDSLGLAHIAGRNRDDPGNNSNGSCKTTILEALTWCFFGEGLPRPQGNTEQGVRADEVLNDRLLKQCRVRSDVLDDDGTVHVVERWRKYKASGESKQSTGVRLTTTDSQGSADVSEALDEKETNRLICQSLGITHDIWCRGVVFGQESGFNFCDATARNRQDILTTVMGLEPIDVWHERCRDEKRALTNTMAETGGRLEVLRRVSVERAAADPTALADQWSVDHTAQVASASARLFEIEAQGKVIAADVAALPEVALTVGELRFGVPDNIEAPYRQAASDARTADHAKTVAQGGLQQAQQAMDQVVAFGQQSACPTCGQSIAKEHQDRCVTAAKETFASAKQVFSKASTDQHAAQDRLSRLHEAYQDASRQVEQDMAQHRSQLAEHERTGKHRRSLESSLARSRADWRNQQDEINRLISDVNPYTAQIAQHAADLEKAQEEVRLVEASQKSIGESLDTCIWWDKEFPRLRTWLFDAVVDVLAVEANRWLGVMSRGVIWIQISTTKKVGKRLKDELDVQIFRWNKDGTITTRPYRIWSGGEKRRVSLAVDLGLSRLMSCRAAKAYGFIAMDEVDRHLDDRGKEGLRQVLDELRQEKETVITITHDREFQASFDQEIEVIKEHGEVRMEIKDGQETAAAAEG